MKLRTIVLCILCYLFIAGNLHAKPKLGPPSIQLRSSLSNIVRAKLISISSDYTLKFEKIEDLHNTAEENLTMLSNEHISSLLLKDKVYIISFNTHRISELTSKISKVKGPSIIANVEGASPAIISDNKNIKKILAYPISESIKSPSSLINIILSGIHNKDQQVRDFFITELLTRARIINNLDNKQILSIANLLNDDNTSLKSKDFILQYGNQILTRVNKNVLHNMLRNHLKYMPVQIDLGSSQASFVRTCLNKIGPLSKDQDIALIARWLKSNSLVIVQTARNLLHDKSYKAEIMELNEAYQATLLNKNTRQLIKRLL